jgi:WhiB family redox-sensing transcriptional regulator
MASEAITKEQYASMPEIHRPAPISLKGQQTEICQPDDTDHTEADSTGWRRFAACVSLSNATELFFPPNHFELKADKLEREHRAKQVCGGCAVRLACLDYALSIHEQHGVWGGLNEQERKQLRPKRR